MSWLFSRVLVEEYLVENSLDGEQSVPLSGSNTPQAYCAPDKMTGFSRISRFGMTFKPLTEDRGKELLTLYRAGFHAKTLVQPEKELELQEPDQECGHTWRGSLAKYNPSTHLWKTAQCSLFVDLEQSLEIFPKSGMTVNGLLWELPMLEQTINVTESGLSEKLPTPSATDYKNQPTSKSWKAKGGINFKLSNPEIRAKWATPTTMDTLPPKSAQALHKEATQARLGRSKPANLRDQISNMQKWPTPRAFMHKDSTTDRGKSNLGEQVGGQLNPTWVEWLMGWPLGWTDLKPLVTDKSPCAPPPPGKL